MVDEADARAQILEREMNVRETFVANDLPAYYAHFAEDLRIWTPEGLTDLPTYKRFWSDYIARGARVLALEYLDMLILVGASADAAVATFRVRVRIRAANGNESEDEYQETDVWFKRAGHWQIVHAHYSRVPMPPLTPR
jgi:ketosteroid isomerase-like protein